jgi:hypothetical protein
VSLFSSPALPDRFVEQTTLLAMLSYTEWASFPISCLFSRNFFLGFEKGEKSNPKSRALKFVETDFILEFP